MAGKINVSLDIEEIILIKESLYDAAMKSQKYVSRHSHTNMAFIAPARQKSDAMQKLIEKLSIYGYGYRE